MNPTLTAALTAPLTGSVTLRPVRPEDAASYCEAIWRSLDQLAPWEPRRPEEWYDPGFQAKRFAEMLEKDNLVPWVLADGDRVVGTAILSNIVHGAWRNGDIGYWVDVAEAGKGLATAALTEVCRLADCSTGSRRVPTMTTPGRSECC